MDQELRQIIDFLHKIEKLKSEFRYTESTAKRKESVADHTWRLGLMVFLFAQQLNLDLDVTRAAKIALVHDLAESVTGDIDYIDVAQGRVSKDEKDELEIKAMELLTNNLPKTQKEEIFGLWMEYNQVETPEAKYVKALDKLETLSQLVERGYEIYDVPEMIYNYADEPVRNYPELEPVLDLIKEEIREEFEKGGMVLGKEGQILINKWDITDPQEDDFDMLMRIAEEWMIDSQTKELDTEALDVYKQTLKNNSSDSSTNYLVLRLLNGIPIGILGYRVPEEAMLTYKSDNSERTCELFNMYLASSYHGQGLGYELIKNLFKRAKQDGFSEVIWNSGPRFKSSAWGFYNKIAGKPIAVAKDYYGKGYDAPVWRVKL